MTAGGGCWGDVVSSYSRAEALADGVLVDAGPLVQEAGFRYPLALTSAAWEAVIACRGGAGQSANGRLWDLLWMLRAAIKGAAGVEIRFQVTVATARGAEVIALRAVVGPGDRGEPVLTVMLAHED